MKATELMIGDWVYNSHNRKNERVEEIGSGLVMLDYNDLYEYDEIEPIPLTAEILERNGFKRSGTNYIMADDYYDIVVHEISDSIWDLQYTNCEMPVGNQQMCVCHVHQLQHALRMCDEEIEIEL